jgi:tetratricopeptide (TPR) repeat protein
MFTFVFLLYLFAAFALSAAMDPDALLQEAEQALERDPTDYKAWCKRALAAYTRAQYADAEKDFKKALSSAPPEKQPDILYNLGNCCFMQKSLQAAAASYRSGLKLRPNDADMLYNYAVTRKLMNEEKKQGDRDDSSKESQSGEGENKQGEKEQNQNEEPKQNEQPEKQPGQQAGEMSREEALRLLRALQEQERETSPNQDKKIIGGLRHEKDW